MEVPTAMAYPFRDPANNPRSGLPNTWTPLSREEVLRGAPACAVAFFDALEDRLPDASRRLCFLKHPDDYDLFALDEDPEHGDWGEGTEAQVAAAIDHVRSLAGPAS